MKITVHYDDSESASLALDAPRLISVVNDYVEWLRQQIKHNDRHELEEAREVLIDSLNEEDLLRWIP